MAITMVIMTMVIMVMAMIMAIMTMVIMVMAMMAMKTGETLSLTKEQSTKLLLCLGFLLIF